MPSPAKASGTKRAAKPRTATATKRVATATKASRAPVKPDGAARTATKTADIPEELAALWAEYKLDESPAARERLILHYAPLVKYVASRVATGLPASVEQADLVSYGMFGLIDALQKFEPGRGNKFETYAIPRIKGAIIDELRAMDWVPPLGALQGARDREGLRRTGGEVPKASADRRRALDAPRPHRDGAPRRREPDLLRLGARARRDGVGRRRPRRAGP